MAEDSEILISRAGEGDAVAITALLERHLPSLRAYIRLRMGPGIRRWETDSDLMQSVCLDVLQSLDGFKYQGEARFRQWLFTTAQHKLVARDRYYRAGKRDTERLETQGQQCLDDPDAVAREIYRALGSPSEHAMRQETLEQIERALDRMPETAREVILMSRLAGLTNAEIAEALGKTESAVTTLLCRSLAELARMLTT